MADPLDVEFAAAARQLGVSESALIREALIREALKTYLAPPHLSP